MGKILTENNAKIAKGLASGWLTVGIHLAPASLSGREVCPWRSKGCTQSCLNTAGRGIYEDIQLARIAKTQWFFQDRNDFLIQLVKEVHAAKRRAVRLGKRLAVRLNLTSDIPWESIRLDGQTLFETFADVQFYDYTKGIERFSKFVRGDFPTNYHLTFSKSESNQVETFRALASGGNVAVVFADKLPESFMGRKVIDGDKNDLRFLDLAGSIVGLSAKGKAKKDESGFVVENETVNLLEMAATLA